MEPTPQTPSVPARDIGPVPMSFPAVLRNPGLSDRFAHLRIRPTEKAAPSASAARRNKRDDKEGKRWVRRKENATFVGNAHIVAPSRKDYAVPLPNSRATFPQPLPTYLSRNTAVPPVPRTTTEPTSASAGQFSLSLKGMRRELRKSGPRTELLVREVEDELGAWLAQGGVLGAPGDAGVLARPGVPIGTSETIREVARSPAQLVWCIAEDAFTRYVVHCCARYHDIVSFSKDTSGQRLTYLLRPNSTRPSRHTAAPPPGPLDTPPLTDLSEFSDLSAHELDTDPEPPSDRDLSDAEGPRTHPRALAAIVELASAPPSPVMYARAALDEDDGWSVLGGSDIDGDGEPELEEGLAALALASSDGEADVDMAASDLGERAVRRRQGPGPEALRSRLLDRQRRAASSPSRSPARRAPRRVRVRAEAVRVVEGGSTGRPSFYNYLFA